jgi:hypothetical protein
LPPFPFVGNVFTESPPQHYEPGIVTLVLIANNGPWKELSMARAPMYSKNVAFIY